MRMMPEFAAQIAVADVPLPRRGETRTHPRYS